MDSKLEVGNSFADSSHKVDDKSVSKPEDAKKSIKTTLCEIVVLSVAIGISWILLLMAIIFYHLPDTTSTETPTEVSTSMECLSAVPYPIEGGVCQSILESTLLSMNCEPGQPPLVLHDDETNARLLIPALSQSPSPECREAAIPLLCVHLFGLCDSSGVSIQPTSGQCRDIRDNLCKEEWQAAEMFGFELPNCEFFPEELASCTGSEGSASIISSSEPGIIPLNSSTNADVLPCQENFFRPDELGGCVANCHTWSQYSQSVTIGTDVAIALSSIIGFGTGLAVIIISIFRYKKIFVFPSIFIVYMTCDVLITGILYTYTVLQLPTWWLLHTSALLWKLVFPFHARAFDMSRKTKYIHIACVVIGFAIPLVPVIALMAKFAVEVQSNEFLQAANVTFVSGGLGFVMGRFPAVLCFGFNSTVTYYTIVLPTIIIFFVGMPELIVLFAFVHKKYGLFIKRKSISSYFKFGTPERKLLVALCFYVLLTAIAIPSFVLSTRGAPFFAEQFTKYLVCEAQGLDPNNPGLCDEFRDSFREHSYPMLAAAGIFLINMFPVMFLIYTIDFQELKEKFQAKKKRANSQSQSELRSTQITSSETKI